MKITRPVQLVMYNRNPEKLDTPEAPYELKAFLFYNTAEDHSEAFCLPVKCVEKPKPTRVTALQAREYRSKGLPVPSWNPPKIEPGCFYIPSKRKEVINEWNNRLGKMVGVIREVTSGLPDNVSEETKINAIYAGFTHAGIPVHATPIPPTDWFLIDARAEIETVSTRYLGAEVMALDHETSDKIYNFVHDLVKERQEKSQYSPQERIRRFLMEDELEASKHIRWTKRKLAVLSKLLDKFEKDEIAQFFGMDTESLEKGISKIVEK